MPLVNMPLDRLLALVNGRGGGDVIDAARVPDTLHEMGVEVEEVTTVSEHRCTVCGNVMEQTEAQGDPLTCSQCGADFRAQADAVERIGESQVVRLDMLAVRPDIFDAGGMARYMRGFLGVQTGLAEYEIEPAQWTVRVDPALSKDESYRPFIACAVLRDVTLDNQTIKALMNLQEDLHWALGRDRKLASIGAYDLDKLSGNVIRYDAVRPDGVRFVPLGFAADDAASNLTPAEILEKHKTGQAYAGLLKPLSAYPLLRDESGTVLSMPPIINSEATRVTQQSRNLFVDVTGVAPRAVDRALNVLVTNMKEIAPDLRIEAVRIEGPDGARATPDLAPMAMELRVADAAATIGAPLDQAAIRGLLERMGHGVDTPDGERLAVRVPAWRNDVMHPIDLIEDAAVAFGYENLAPTPVPTFTVGAPREIEEQSAIARKVFVGLGFHQVITLTLTSEPAAFEKWRLKANPRAVQLEHPISIEQTMCRVSLLPGMLETLAINKQYDLPQYLFEVGDCCFVDEASETGAREERFAAAVMIGTHIGYADIRAVCDAFAKEFDREIRVGPVDHASLIAGRAAVLKTEAGTAIGFMGELHPEVLEAYGLRHPVALMEFSLAALLVE